MNLFLNRRDFEFEKTPSASTVFLIIIVTGFLFFSSIPMVSIIMLGLRSFGELSGICNTSGIEVLIYPNFAEFILFFSLLLMSIIICLAIKTSNKFIQKIST